METSLRYGGDSKSLRIHAKEKFPLDSKTTRLQVHGELDTRIGAPSYVSAMIRRFYPDLYASLGVGVQYDKQDKLTYRICGKKAFPLTSELFTFNIKGLCSIDKDFQERKSKVAAELSWAVLNFQNDQTVRFKIGYEVNEKGAIDQHGRGKGRARVDDTLLMVPYMQIRENNWTLNADLKGRWNVRFDL